MIHVANHSNKPFFITLFVLLLQGPDVIIFSAAEVQADEKNPRNEESNCADPGKQSVIKDYEEVVDDGR